MKTSYWERKKRSDYKSAKEQYKERVEVYNSNPKTCLHCKVILEYDRRYNKFCSQSCSAISNNIARGKRLSQATRRIKEKVKKKNYYRKRRIDLKEKVRNCKYCTVSLTNHHKVCAKCLDYNSKRKFYERLGLSREDSDFAAKALSILKTEYYDNNLSYIDIESKYKINKNTLFKFFKSHNLTARSFSESSRIALKTGKRSLPRRGNPKFKTMWHTTWDNQRVYLRSSYEIEYAFSLDQQRVAYRVEAFRIEYFDSQKNIYRIALPDFYLVESNTIVEIKSSWTYDKINMKDRFKAYQELGYNTQLYLEKRLCVDLDNALQ